LGEGKGRCLLRPYRAFVAANSFAHHREQNGPLRRLEEQRTMHPSRIRAWIKKYDNIGICAAAVYFGGRYLWKLRFPLLVGSVALVGLAWIVFVCQPKSAPSPAPSLLTSVPQPAPIVPKPEIARKVLEDEWSEAYDELFEAIKAEDVEKVKTLLHEGISPNAIGATDTPLTAAISTDNLALVTLLLDNGADPNWTGDIQHLPRPLGLAASHGNFDMVKLLVERGADPTYRDEVAAKASVNGNDDSALYYASKELMFHPKNEELKRIVAYLKEHGAR
jgi:hypothetical protein